MSKITQLQQRRLQTIYSQWAKRFLFEDSTRELRLQEMAQRISRKQPLASANDLNSREAKLLIDSFQAELGIAETVPPAPRSRRDREAAAKDGRHDQIHSEATLVSPQDIARIGRELDRLGWNQHRLDAFLSSPSGPNGHRATIRTRADANRVYWALKRMKPSPNLNSIAS